MQAQCCALLHPPALQGSIACLPVCSGAKCMRRRVPGMLTDSVFFVLESVLAIC